MFTALGNILLLENLNITLNDVSVDVITNKYAKFSSYHSCNSDQGKFFRKK